MLVCQCNFISDRQIEQAIRGLLAADPWQVIVPAKVFRGLGERCNCAGCVPDIVEMITRVTEAHRAELETPSAASADQ